MENVEIAGVSWGNAVITGGSKAMQHSKTLTLGQIIRQQVEDALQYDIESIIQNKKVTFFWNKIATVKNEFRYMWE